MAAAAGSTDITLWLRRWHDGEKGALEEITRIVYDDLRRLAAHYLRSEDPGHTLQATGLVHELYLRINSLQDRIWKNRGHFMAVSAQMMRRILIDHARRRALARRDDGRSAPSAAAHACPDVLDVDRALEKLNAVYPRHAYIVELRFFGGFEAPEIALALDLSVRTVERDWQFAKAWLQHEITGF